MSSLPAASRSATDLFAQLAGQLLNEPCVQQGTGFGAVPDLRADKKIFAMLCRGELVVKLPRHRVDQLVADGTAARFDARRDGRLMKEWATIPPEHGHALGGARHRGPSLRQSPALTSGGQTGGSQFPAVRVTATQLSRATHTAN